MSAHRCYALCADPRQTTKDIYDKLRMILTGEESVKLYLEFLKKNNKVDLLILKNTKVTFMTSHDKHLLIVS